MKKIIVVFMLLVISGITIAQISKDEKVEQLKNREDVKVTEVKKDLLKIEYPDGKVMLKNIADFKYPVSSIQNQVTYSPNFDSTIIDLTTIDTTLYYQKYQFWQEVPLGKGPNDFLLIGDVNNNNLPELYGQMKDYTSELSDVVIMEMNTNKTFDSLYTYDSTNIARTIYDVNKDGLDEIHIVSVDVFNTPVNKFNFYRKSSNDSLALDLDFVFAPFQSESQQNDNMFGDWDEDSFTDQIFHRLSIGLFIYEYNPAINNFDSVYFYDYTSINLEFAGFTIGDFDQDGKTEFFTGSTHGDVLCVENNGNNSYAPTWTGMVETNNAYQLAQTNDIDRNGKNEIWVGGDAFFPGIGSMTRITIFEADGNDSYQVVGRIDLVGVFSFFAQNYQPVDVDNDGVEEMMICIEQTLVILKFNGSPDHQTYELFYFKQNDFENNNILYFGSNMYDLTGDGKEELLINVADDPPGLGTIKWLNYVYKPNFPVSVDNENYTLPNEFSLSQNYPNPFNPQTNIEFDIAKTSFTTVKVYNILGKEIKTLLEKELTPGNYTINWEAKNSNSNLLSSGVYLIRLSANGESVNFTKTIKAIFLK